MRFSDSSHVLRWGRVGLSRAATLGVTCALVAVIAIIDFKLEDDATSHLYYLPILLAAIRLGRPAGLAVAAVAIVLAHLADPALSRFQYGEADLMELILFVTVALVASKLASDGRDLRRLALTDDLTGLHNLRSFEALAAEMIDRQRSDGGSVSMLSLDVDHLKQLNDTYGHLTGADAVKHVGKVIGATLPANAVGCRYGGDEFAIALPEANSIQIAALAERIEHGVAMSSPTLDGRPFPAKTLSVSIGWATSAVDSVPTSALFERMFRVADEVMYANKRARHATSDALLRQRPAGDACELQTTPETAPIPDARAKPSLEDS
jgi:diguanylate cyclase (GGDEF)-like protein